MTDLKNKNNSVSSIKTTDEFVTVAPAPVGCNLQALLSMPYYGDIIYHTVCQFCKFKAPFVDIKFFTSKRDLLFVDGYLGDWGSDLLADLFELLKKEINPNIDNIPQWIRSFGAKSLRNLLMNKITRYKDDKRCFKKYAQIEYIESYEHFDLSDIIYPFFNPSQNQLFALKAQGKENKEISVLMNISLRSVNRIFSEIKHICSVNPLAKTVLINDFRECTHRVRPNPPKEIIENKGFKTIHPTPEQLKQLAQDRKAYYEANPIIDTVRTNRNETFKMPTYKRRVKSKRKYNPNDPIVTLSDIHKSFKSFVKYLEVI
jgi:hypothetical protein